MLCSENNGADQLCSYYEADLSLFLHMGNVGFLITCLRYYYFSIFFIDENFICLVFTMAF